MPRLIVIKGPDEGKQFELAGDIVTVGRDATSKIRLVDTEISRRHAEILHTDDGYRVHDKGSANGTFVNNQSIQDALLRPGDRVQFGQSILVYSAGRGDGGASGLASRISLIGRQDAEFASSIVGTLGEAEGSRLLARPDLAGTPWLKNALANLGVLYETTQAVSHILDLDQLLERVLELVFRSIPADRGCILLDRADEGGSDPIDGSTLEPRAARWRNESATEERMAVSRTIIDHVLREKQGVLINDAASDERFQSGQSVVRLGIRAAICVPMKGRHGTVGVLYLDARGDPAAGLTLGPLHLQDDKFGADQLALASAIAHQAAVAVEGTRYYQAMLQAERLAAVGQTIAALSHHIKNILQGLYTGGEIVNRGLGDQDLAFIAQGWKIVEKNQSKIKELVMDMLSYSKEREPLIEATDVNALVRDVAEVVGGRASDRQIVIDLNLDDHLPVCPADGEGIHRALLNLLSNAIDAVEEVEQPRIRLTTSRAEGDWLHIAIGDNGPGIPPEKLDDIFRPFVSSKGARGTGLGLAVSRKILREHGGDILVESTLGQGSTFTLCLPLRAMQHAEAPPTSTFPAFPG